MTFFNITDHSNHAAAAAKSLQSCPTLCDPIDGSLLGSSVSGILQARILEWVAISFSNAWKWKAKVKSLSHVWLLATSWTTVYQAPPSMVFSRQEYWRGVPLPVCFSDGHLLQKSSGYAPSEFHIHRIHSIIKWLLFYTINTDWLFFFLLSLFPWEARDCMSMVCFCFVAE